MDESKDNVKRTVRYGNYGKVVLPFNWWFMVVSPRLMAATLVVGSVAALLEFGAVGLAFPALVSGFAFLGQKDWLGPVQTVYSIFDTQVSLLRASVELLVGDSDGTWDVDAELREVLNETGQLLFGTDSSKMMN